MPIYLEYFDYIKRQILEEKMAELAKRTKKKNHFKNFTYEKVVEDDKDAMEVADFKIAKDGSMLTFMKGAPEPVRMYPDQQSVQVIATYKRLFPLLAESLAQIGWIKRIITLLAIKFNIQLFSKWFDYYFKINVVLLNEENYSQPVKELRRVLTGRIDENFINAFTLILEYDSVYRQRVQDILPLLDKSKLTGIISTIKEIQRLFSIMAGRETNMKDVKIAKWGKISKFISLVLFLSPKTVKLVISILKDLKLEEISLSKEDRYWAYQWGIYDFDGITLENRRKINKQLYGG